jgi:ribosomal protein L34E
MRTDCKKCGRSFKVLDQRKEKVADHRKKEDHSERPFGYHKFSKAGDDGGKEDKV